ncbi:hypothetical protein SLEP1_g48291 [Rubroshorea leprosula]|uniref:Uncharacterized protein n=1 Tax=Rubroshorea leprosula TaxID=152421 RepID=A0AAV5LTE3_9ROSI|nr:hypothetical protein SLEP1_g48291 [Rubroshorea leprosula]
MAATTKMLAATISLLIFFATLHFLNGEPEPTISASPAVLPYVNASSFFPSSPNTEDAPPDAEAFAPAHISEESSSSSAMFNTLAAMALPFFSGILYLAAIRYVI